ncbi:hypothetical protein [Emcibacter sp. SYSU 3D8]|uniref:hypothetical protein n=1 Tax=Emcibacter sp. SYSU 3D8 TaxID=3133969 RepID=UPI0031FEB923
MLHAEMVLVVPVLAFTFLVMGWIVSQFRSYLKQRDAIMASWEEDHSPVYQDNHHHREAA